MFIGHMWRKNPQNPLNLGLKPPETPNLAGNGFECVCGPLQSGGNLLL